ncbi:MAG: peptide ABC transporter substrate-binding protein [Gammaproteobacteria bacterium]|nr:MAG: peptide ABC transporter substrate-binding protein [Gammaproteobacteria bacterium]
MTSFLLFGCGPKVSNETPTTESLMIGGPSGNELAQEQVFRKNNGSDPGTLDPHRAEGVPASNVLRDLYEGLVSEAANGDYIPGVAESWSISEDGKTYRFKIREEAIWSNGDKVVAEDFVFSLRRSVDPKTLSNYSSMLYPIKNARDVVLGKLPTDMLSVSAENEKTLVIELEEPTPYFISLLTHSTTYPVHPPSVKEYGTSFTRPENMISNGAFTLKDWRIQDYILLERNEKYWDNPSTTLSQVYYYPLDNPDASLRRYRANELDFTDTTPSEQLPWIKKNLKDELKITPYFGSYYYGFNNSKPPFKDNPELRMALSLAVNRTIITDIVLGAGQIPAFTFVPPVKQYQGKQPEWAKLTQEEREGLARELYTKAGYSDANPLSIEIIYNTSENHKRVALAVTSMWKKVLGVETKLRNQEWKVFLETRRLQEETEVFRGGWIGDYDDPYTFSELLHSENEMNHSGYASEEYDALLRSASLKPAGKERTNDLLQAEQVMLNDMPVIPLYFYVSQHLIKPWVFGLEGNVMDHHYSKYVKILKTETLISE